MRRLLLVLIATLALVPSAHAWTWPADGRILAPFAFDPGKPYTAGQHRGIDIAGTPAAPVRAPAAGSVSFAGTVPGSGRSVTIETPDGWSVTLTHLGQLAVKKDAAVAEGDPVGTLADGGSGDDPYVQLGIRRTADAQGYVDPRACLHGHLLPRRRHPSPALHQPSWPRRHPSPSRRHPSPPRQSVRRGRSREPRLLQPSCHLAPTAPASRAMSPLLPAPHGRRTPSPRRSRRRLHR